MYLRVFDEVEKILDPIYDLMGSYIHADEYLTSKEKISFDQEKNGYVIRVLLPGVKKENVNVSVSRNKLTLSVYTEKSKDSNWFFNRYSRKFYLSEDIDIDRITAKLEDGVLTIVLPRKAEDTITVKVE